MTQKRHIRDGCRTPWRRRPSAGALPASGPLRAVMLLAAVTILAAPLSARAQECDPRAGTLGIQGLRCEGCSYRMSESGIEEARFRTEPQVIAVARGFTGGDRLRAGDRIVAVDGTLVTTRAGSQRLVGLQSDQRLTLRVRRDGRVVELDMVAGSACELRRRLEEEEVEVDRIDVVEEGWGVVSLPPAPAPTARPARPARPDSLPALPPLPPRPAVPAPPAVPPSGWLGFGLRCSECGMRDGVFFFSGPPEITSVAEDGPAGRAGLRSGDLLVAVEGQDITGPGARRFSEIEPGQTVTLTVERDGVRRTVSITAEERPAVLPATPAAPRSPADERVRFEGGIGDVRIEVRGAPVTVTRDEGTGELVIRTAGNIIRIRQDG